MKAKYLNDSGDVCVIRPLVYTRESETKEFSYQGRLPVINENCPACFEEPKEVSLTQAALSGSAMSKEMRSTQRLSWRECYSSLPCEYGRLDGNTSSKRIWCLYCQFRYRHNCGLRVWCPSFLSVGLSIQID